MSRILASVMETLWLPALIALAVVPAVDRTSHAGGAAAVSIPYSYRSHPTRSTDALAAVEMMIRGIKKNIPATPTQQDLLAESTYLSRDLVCMDLASDRTRQEREVLSDLVPQLLRSHGILAGTLSPPDEFGEQLAQRISSGAPAILRVQLDEEPGAVVVTGAKATADGKFELTLHDVAASPPKSAENIKRTLWQDGDTWKVGRADNLDWIVSDAVVVKACTPIVIDQKESVYQSNGDTAPRSASPFVTLVRNGEVLTVPKSGAGASPVAALGLVTPAGKEAPAKALARSLLAGGELDDSLLAVEVAPGFLSASPLKLDAGSGCETTAAGERVGVQRWAIQEMVADPDLLPERTRPMKAFYEIGIAAAQTDIPGLLQGMTVIATNSQDKNRQARYVRALLALAGFLDQRESQRAKEHHERLQDLQQKTEVLLVTEQTLFVGKEAMISTYETIASKLIYEWLQDAHGGNELLEEGRYYLRQAEDLRSGTGAEAASWNNTLKFLKWAAAAGQVAGVMAYVSQRTRFYDGFAAGLEQLRASTKDPDLSAALKIVIEVARNERSEMFTRFGNSEDEFVKIAASWVEGEVSAAWPPALAASMGLGFARLIANVDEIQEHAVVGNFAAGIEEETYRALFEKLPAGNLDSARLHHVASLLELELGLQAFLKQKLMDILEANEKGSWPGQKEIMDQAALDEGSEEVDRALARHDRVADRLYENDHWEALMRGCRRLFDNTPEEWTSCKPPARPPASQLCVPSADGCDPQLGQVPEDVRKCLSRNAPRWREFHTISVEANMAVNEIACPGNRVSKMMCSSGIIARYFGPRGEIYNPEPWPNFLAAAKDVIAKRGWTQTQFAKYHHAIWGCMDMPGLKALNQELARLFEVHGNSIPYKNRQRVEAAQKRLMLYDCIFSGCP